jgi:uncharacterized membrane protein SirB2
MSEWYLSLKQAHVALAAASVGLFTLRGAGVLAGARWPMHALARRGSAAIDSLLLAAGAALWWLLSLQPLRDAWLGTKLALVVVYIVLGSLALKRAPGRGAKAVAFVAALACVAAAAAVARAHDPRAPLQWLGILP